MPTSFKSLEGIVAFVEVVSNGSFTKAAEISGHSTSYISKEITKLEERLGVRLLNRTTRSLSLTPEGEVYYQQCQQIVNDAVNAEQSMTGQQQKPKGLLRVSCPVNFGLSKLRPVLAKFTSQHKGVQLDLDLNDRKVDMVAEGYDVIIRASIQQEDSSLISRRFMKSEVITVASPNYIKKNGLPKKPTDLAHHQTISYGYLKQPKLWMYPDKSGQPIQINVDSQVTTNSGEMNLALCIAGKGVTRIPRFHLTDELTQNKLVELFSDYPQIEIDIHLVYPSRKHMSSKVRSFIDFVVAELGD